MANSKPKNQLGSWQARRPGASQPPSFPAGLGGEEARKPEASKPSSFPAEAGFSLIELLVSILITSLMVTAIYSIFRVQTHSVKIQESRLEAQEYARAVLDMMVREIRNATYNPLAIAGTAVSTGCDALGDGAPGVLTATSTAIGFSYDYRGSASGSAPDGDCNDAHEVITYEYKSPGPNSCPAGFGDITRTAKPEGGAGLVEEVLTNCNVPSGDFSLAYYALSATSPMSPVVAADIQRVQITLTVQSKNLDQQFGGQLNASVTSNADLRNRGL